MNLSTDRVAFKQQLNNNTIYLCMYLIAKHILHNDDSHLLL